MSKTWDITINNYTPNDISQLEHWKSEVNRLVVNKEVGTEGTPHLQIRVTFKRNYRFASVKKLLRSGNIDVTKAAADSLYCMKLDGECIIDIDNRKQGCRLGTVIEDIKAGATLYELWQNHTGQMVRYEKGIKRAVDMLNPEDNSAEFSLEDNCTRLDCDAITNWDTCHIIWGESQIGKTQYALAHFEHPLLVHHMDDLQGFVQGYHDGIVFDDMDFKHVPRSNQIYLLDKNNNRTIHCRFTNAKIPKHTKKIFTCNYPDIFESWNKTEYTDRAIKNRVTVTEVRLGNNSLISPPWSQSKKQKL